MTVSPGTRPLTLLAFDTATECMSLAVSAHGRVWTHEAEGGAKASTTLIPAVLALLAEAGITLADLDAIAFGRGPGAFTGLRTACSVAQGLALGADKPVLPIDTLLAVAEDARADAGADGADIWVLMDARMNEIYAAHCVHADGHWQLRTAPMLSTAAALNALWATAPPQWVAGTALTAFEGQLALGAARCSPQALPRAAAMLPLADALWRAGGAVDGALALPLYVRDKVAQTTAEREAAARAATASFSAPVAGAAAP